MFITILTLGWVYIHLLKLIFLSCSGFAAPYLFNCNYLSYLWLSLLLKRCLSDGWHRVINSHSGEYLWRFFWVVGGGGRGGRRRGREREESFLLISCQFVRYCWTISLGSGGILYWRFSGFAWIIAWVIEFLDLIERLVHVPSYWPRGLTQRAKTLLGILFIPIYFAGGEVIQWRSLSLSLSACLCLCYKAINFCVIFCLSDNYWQLWQFLWRSFIWPLHLCVRARVCVNSFCLRGAAYKVNGQEQKEYS